MIPISIDSIEYSRSDPLAERPGDAWQPASLPFEVHSRLAADDVIPHPYRDDDADSVQWVQEHSWWVRARFVVDAPVVGSALKLHGLDTVATIWMNGQMLGHHANVFRPAVLPVDGSLRRGENELLVRIDPPLLGLVAPEESVETATRVATAMGRPDDGDGHGMFGDLRTVRRRKPIVDWGWDFAPRIPSIGLAAAELVAAGDVVVESIALDTTRLDTEARRADLAVSVVSNAPAGASVTVTLTAPDANSDDPSHRIEMIVDRDGRAEADFALADPQLWWPCDMGEQPLYTITARVGDASSTRRVGIRTIRLDRSDDGKGGRHFRFLVNDIPVFARGACVVPSDLLEPRPDRDRALVALAADAGMNMLRIWGGGGYGGDELYDAADEYGVLIWQDFPFACADYPEDEALLEEVAAEARFQARRLGWHASLALWCGNNEVHAMHQLAVGDLEPGPWGHTYFHEVLPEIVAEETPGIAYWPGSPYGESDVEGVNGTRDGDRHAWEVWHGLPLGAESPEHYDSFGEAAHFRRYRYDTGRFISEFGIIAAPARETLAAWIGADELHLESPVLQSHVRDKPKQKVFGILEIETGLPDDLDEYVRFTQAVQAEGLKYGIEHYRRQEPHTAGTLIWQLNDPWPGISWSLIDYDLRLKPAYHVVRRAFAAVASSFVLTDDGELELWVANSRDQAAALHFDVRVESIDGAPGHSASVEVVAAPHSATRIWTLPPGTATLTADTVARVRERTRRTPSNEMYFAPMRDVRVPEPRFTTEIRELRAGSVLVTITAETSLRAATVTSPFASVRFDDNVVDLAPGEVATITVTGLPDAESLRSLRVVTHTPQAVSLPAS